MNLRCVTFVALRIRRELYQVRRLDIQYLLVI